MDLKDTDTIKSCLGRKISGAALVGAGERSDELRLDFVGGGRLMLWDAGQDCCEERYMTAEDDLPGVVGGETRQH